MRGTIRGMHYQVSPAAEAKLVRCTRGAVYDVIVDLRRESPTYRRWFAVVLSLRKYHKMLYVPKDFAHGFQTLTDDAEAAYQMSEAYAPEYARGFRWNDAAFGIDWPESVRMISDRDRTYDDFVER
ncbi:MAG: dTDP-4-dehydrorhamnose 3,5-epimerase family protein [Nitrospiraceae bacterium]